ncbi:hypothetical protein WS67_12190 [Burkholderia singularis]|uniref:Phage protein n=1 Tax=Burkholderia singularis TaxID=1503053 RepID=A0A103E2P1_9BURK|nr:MULTISPECIES: hypothetical protein [Burkholderia]KVE27254.1 hypothetical protein WS67_12190 [Burkholderia singularis]KVE33747.1 hypothetical protein WS68_11280 [Burkholderia sp. TSV86]
MASEVQIANRALTKLGSSRITSLGEDSKAAATLNSMFATVRDAELTEHRWHFAKARALLPKLAESPAFGFANQYRLPQDHLSLIQIGSFTIYRRTDTRGLYSLEGGNILTDLDAPLPIRYVRRVTDPNAFAPLFIEAFACRLAAESCEELTQSATKQQAAWAAYSRAIAAAVRINAIERPPQSIADDTWIESRHGTTVCDRVDRY